MSDTPTLTLPELQQWLEDEVETPSKHAWCEQFRSGLLANLEDRVYVAAQDLESQRSDIRVDRPALELGECPLLAAREQLFADPGAFREEIDDAAEQVLWVAAERWRGDDIDTDAATIFEHWTNGKRWSLEVPVLTPDGLRNIFWLGQAGYHTCRTLNGAMDEQRRILPGTDRFDATGIAQWLWRHAMMASHLNEFLSTARDAFSEGLHEIGMEQLLHAHIYEQQVANLTTITDGVLNDLFGSADDPA
jgi:hypothetical protein